MKRYGIHVAGLVQGVGFRPFLHRLAAEHRIHGSVRNTCDGVLVDAEGASSSLLSFLSAIRDRAPTCARIDMISVSSQPLAGVSDFTIVPSDAKQRHGGEAVTSVPKDLAPCKACLREMHDPRNRRYCYPFITCNMCGPRYTIAEHLPFDRHHTAMADFPMCTACTMEFTSTHDRRFHAQTISCPDCGPRLSWSSEESSESGAQAFTAALAAVRGGGVIAVKGVGGYHLICLARDAAAVERIRRLKDRPMKPLAVMAPDFQAVQSTCEVDPLAAAWLQGPVAPIVLLERKAGIPDDFVSSYVAPMTSNLGVMLPSSPLYHLFASELKEWLVVTSANQSGAPTAICEEKVRVWTGHRIEGILSHNRRITHLADDSVVRPADSSYPPQVDHDAMIIVRHGRGLAPTEVQARSHVSKDGVAVGAHQKAAFALRVGQKIVLSPYLGDWDHADTKEAFVRELSTVSALYGFEARHVAHVEVLACDAHPHYGSSVFAHERHPAVRRVQHHAAHLEALIVERAFVGKALGVVWDGTGLGDDGTIWGGEFFLVDGDERERVASIKKVPLWGGEKAIREPRRVALGLLWEAYSHQVKDVPSWREKTSERERAFLPMAYGLEEGIVSTSSMGRLFDGMAALLGIDTPSYYEAQSAMALEALAREGKGWGALATSWERDDQGLLRWDWCELVRRAASSTTREERAQVAGLFHATLARVISELAHIVEVDTVLLTGGVFQNALLMRLSAQECSHRHLKFIHHTAVPPGDGGLALGQLSCAERRSYVSRDTRPNPLH